MTVQPIIMWPDPRLAQALAPVTVFDDVLKQVAADVLDSMRAAPGVGATGPHIGAPVRLFVLDLPGDAAPQICVNPEITWLSDERAAGSEGSISMPGAHADITRSVQLRFRYQDLDGAVHEAEAAGFRAACVQHEIDQLNGIFWLDRLSKLKRDRVVARWRKLARAGA